MITQFVIGCSKTVNLGNYQNIKIEASVTVAVKEGDHLIDLKGRAQEELSQLMAETYRAQRKGDE